MKKVKFLRVPSGSKVRGIYASTSSGYIVPGEPCCPNEGGGFIGDITFDGGFLHFRKVDKDGKPMRDYGVASIKGERKAQIVGDAVAISADGFVIVFDEENEPQAAKPVPDASEQPAKPIQQGPQRR